MVVFAMTDRAVVMDDIEWIILLNCARYCVAENEVEEKAMDAVSEKLAEQLKQLGVIIQ